MLFLSNPSRLVGLVTDEESPNFGAIGKIEEIGTYLDSYIFEVRFLNEDLKSYQTDFTRMNPLQVFYRLGGEMGVLYDLQRRGPASLLIRANELQLSRDQIRQSYEQLFKESFPKVSQDFIANLAQARQLQPWR